MFESQLNNQLIELIKRKGYQFGDNGSLASVKYFTNIDEELFSLYNGVGVVINHNSVVIELTGKDSLDFLHRITTNSILNLEKNKLVKTIFTNEKGRILGIADVISIGEKLILKTDKCFKDKIIAWINRYVISDDVSVKDISAEFTTLEFYGHQKNSFVEYLFNSQNIEVGNGHIQQTKFEDDDLFLSLNNLLPSNISQLSIDIKNHNLVPLFEFMFENKGPYDFNLIGQTAFESFRIEQGILKPENEINDNFNPHELNLSELIDTKKGCYIGQEVLARLETYDKVQKKLTGLVFSDDFQLGDERVITDERNEIAGYITSKTYSYKLKKIIGLGVLRMKYFTNESNLIYKDNNNNEIKVEIHELPFIKNNR